MPPGSLARTVREQGLQWAKLQVEHDSLQRENLDLRITIHDVAESVAALIAALLPGCPAAADGGLVPTAATIRAAAAQAASDAALAAAPATGPTRAETTSSDTRETERCGVEKAAATIQAAARGWSCRTRIRSPKVPARVELANAGVQAAATVSEPELGAIVSEMRELASYVRQLPTDGGGATVGRRPSSAPAREPHMRRPAAKAEGASARRPPMAAVPENCARPQSAPARRNKRDEQSILGPEDKEEARRAVLVARQSAVSANSWKTGLPAEQIPATRTHVHGGPRPASASSARSSAAASAEYESGGVRQESEEAWLARQPGGKAGHLSYVKSRVHNPVALTAERDKQALREQAAEAALAAPPVQWLERGGEGWGHWVSTSQSPAESEQLRCQDAVQISHSQLPASRRPQSAPPASSASRAHRRERRRIGSARPAKSGRDTRSIPPIFGAHEGDTLLEAHGSEWAAAADSTTSSAIGWSERAEWKRGVCLCLCLCLCLWARVSTSVFCVSRTPPRCASVCTRANQVVTACQRRYSLHGRRRGADRLSIDHASGAHTHTRRHTHAEAERKEGRGGGGIQFNPQSFLDTNLMRLCVSQMENDPAAAATILGEAAVLSPKMPTGSPFSVSLCLSVPVALPLRLPLSLSRSLSLRHTFIRLCR